MCCYYNYLTHWVYTTAKLGDLAPVAPSIPMPLQTYCVSNTLCHILLLNRKLIVPRVHNIMILIVWIGAKSYNKISLSKPTKTAIDSNSQ